jgi:hypothetical protein
MKKVYLKRIRDIDLIKCTNYVWNILWSDEYLTNNDVKPLSVV